MVAYLQDGAVDDDRIIAKTSEKPKPSGLPLTHEAALKWFYKDPQGEIQGETGSINVTGLISQPCRSAPFHPSGVSSGPFSNQEMTEWFQAGYFTMSLLVKRGCDEVFQPLGEIMKIWARVPFTPGPAPPPLQVYVYDTQPFLFHITVAGRPGLKMAVYSTLSPHLRHIFKSFFPHLQ